MGELDCLPRAVDYCILMGTVMRDDTSQRSHRLAVTQPVVQPTSSTRSPRIAESVATGLTNLAAAGSLSRRENAASTNYHLRYRGEYGEMTE